MKINQFISVCKKLGMVSYSDYNNDDLFWDALSSNSLTAYYTYYTFSDCDFYVAKFHNDKAYIWSDEFERYKAIDNQTPEGLEEQINLFHKNHKEYLIQNKIKNIKKDFEY